MLSVLNKNPHLVARSRPNIAKQTSLQRSHSLVAHFRRSRSWFPTQETIDEGDRQKRFLLHESFEDVAKDNDGRIDVQKLRRALESAILPVQEPAPRSWLSDSEVERLMTQYSLDRQGELATKELEKLVNDGLLLAEKLSDYQEAFNAVDSDKSGEITARELALALIKMGWPESECTTEKVTQLMKKYGVNLNGNLGLASFMALMKDNMLDARELLAYMGARPQSPTTTRAVIQAVSAEGFRLILSAEGLHAAVTRAAEQDRLLLLMAGATWCTQSRAIMQHLQALADAYHSVDVCLLWGNMNHVTKELFRDQLLVRSTPAFFIFRAGDLVAHWSGGDPARLEYELRKRLLPGAEGPPQPVFT